MLTPIIHSKIYHNLTAIKSNSLVANAIKLELQKRPVNYAGLAQMVKDQIKDNQQVMEIIMGADNVVFFKNLKLEEPPTKDQINAMKEIYDTHGIDRNIKNLKLN